MEQFIKPMKGVIFNWHLRAGHIFGYQRTEHGVCEITTSKMVKMYNMGTFGVCETANSVYVLADKE